MGSGEWKGEWSDNSDMWEKHPEVKRFLRPESKDDGKFWISKEDFSNNFEAISICMIWNAGRLTRASEHWLELSRTSKRARAWE